MSKLVFDKTGEHFYETGVKDCVLYPFATEAVEFTEGKTNYAPGVAWNGITSITEKPSGAEATALYADDRKYLNLISKEDFGVTIEAYTYPDEFAACDGSATLAAGVRVGQQKRQSFGLCYKTSIGDDLNAADGSVYKLHLVYGCIAAPSERAYATVNDSPEAITMSWEVSTTPVELEGFVPMAHVEIDSRTVAKGKLQSLLDALYGKDATSEPASNGIEPHLPMPDAIKTMMSAT